MSVFETKVDFNMDFMQGVSHRQGLGMTLICKSKKDLMIEENDYAMEIQASHLKIHRNLIVVSDYCIPRFLTWSTSLYSWSPTNAQLFAAIFILSLVLVNKRIKVIEPESPCPSCHRMKCY